MKVIKIVGEGAERRTYVEGGPVCRYKGCAEMICKDGQAYHTVGKIYFGECPACDGTGVIPVELWPDAVKAEWLEKNNPTDGVLTISPSTVGWGIWFYVDNCPWDGEEPIYAPNGDDAWGEAKGFSAALTAAVIAVAEEEK